MAGSRGDGDWLGLLGAAPEAQRPGRGELAVGLGFGVLMPWGADFVQRGSYASLPVLVGIPYGLLITSLLYINQFPGYDADRICAKRHLVVRLGREAARWGYLVLGLASYAALCVVVAVFELPRALLGLLPLPLTLFVARQLFLHAARPWRLEPAIRATLFAAMAQGGILCAVLFLA